MREIKFRAWSGNMWLDGNDANIHPKNPDKKEIELVASYPHSKHILCQFTGLLDKNGKEIYEGDILQGYETTDGYGNGFHYQGKVFWNENEGKWSITDDEDTWDLYDYQFEKIIGNVYENPELLK